MSSTRHVHRQTIAPYTVPNMFDQRSLFGFFTIPPISRQERRTLGDRDAREKNALAERRTGFQRHDPTSNPIESMAQSAGYLSNEERFHTDVVGELKAANVAKVNRTNQTIENRRRDHFEREDQRWRAMDEVIAADAQRGDAMAGTSKRNVGGSGYNIVNYEWRNGYDAEKEKFKEDAAAFRGANHVNAIHKMANPAGYNLITGAPYGQPLPVPPKPMPPAPAARNQYLP